MNMRYRELDIETQRQAPARSRTEGAALLRRAGCLDPTGELTPLGRRTVARLKELAQTMPVAQLFASLNLPVIEASNGACFFPIEQGRVGLAMCSSCGYAAPRALAKSKKTQANDGAPAPMEKVATPECHTIEALAEYLEIPKSATAKALMYTRNSDGRFVFVVIRGDMQLSEEKLSRAIGEFRLATNEEILGAGANEVGYHLRNTNYGRDYLAEIVEDLTLAGPGDACPNCGRPLSIANAEMLANAEGICVGSLLEALAETHHDEKGLTLPAAAAPFDVYLLHLQAKETDTLEQATQLYAAWEQAGISVLFDDRNERAGVKFADADLIGCPVRATLGEKGMKSGMVELKPRARGESTMVAFDEARDAIRSLIQRAL